MKLKFVYPYKTIYKYVDFDINEFKDIVDKNDCKFRCVDISLDDKNILYEVMTGKDLFLILYKTINPIKDEYIISYVKKRTQETIFNDIY
jgi:hypothetical protein